MTSTDVSLDRVERSIEVNAPVARVWSALTRADLLSQWFGERAEIDLRVGGRIRQTWVRPDRPTAPDDCYGTFHGVITEIAEPTVFAFRWAHAAGVEPGPGCQTTVRFRLEPVGGGTRVTVVETGFAGLQVKEAGRALTENSEGWAHELGELAALLA